jgi:hypothetical protein
MPLENYWNTKISSKDHRATNGTMDVQRNLHGYATGVRKTIQKAQTPYFSRNHRNCHEIKKQLTYE